MQVGRNPLQMNVLSYFAPRVFSHGQIANARLVYSVCVQPTMGLNVGGSVCCDGCLKNIYACVCELVAVPYPAIMSQSHTIMPLIAFLCDTSQHHLFTRSQSLAIIVCLWLKPCLRLRKPFAARVCVAGWRNGGGRPCCVESTGLASASESMDLPPSPPPLSPHPSSVPKCLFMHLGSIQFVRRIPPAPPHQPPRAPSHAPPNRHRPAMTVAIIVVVTATVVMLGQRLGLQQQMFLMRPQTGSDWRPCQLHGPWRGVSSLADFVGSETNEARQV